MSSVVPAGAYPRYPPGYEPVSTGYENTINTRALVGFPKWGFVIYRGTYEDDAVWKTCIELIKINVESALRDANQAEILVPDLEWTVIEDHDTLDEASKDTVRQKFREWAANHSVDRDGPGADGPFVAQRVPRFRYCVYIDKTSLDALRGNWVGAPEASTGVSGARSPTSTGPADIMTSPRVKRIPKITRTTTMTNSTRRSRATRPWTWAGGTRTRDSLQPPTRSFIAKAWIWRLGLFSTRATGPTPREVGTQASRLQRSTSHARSELGHDNAAGSARYGGYQGRQTDHLSILLHYFIVNARRGGLEHQYQKYSSIPICNEAMVLSPA